MEVEYIADMLWAISRGASAENRLRDMLPRVGKPEKEKPVESDEEIISRISSGIAKLGEENERI